MIQFLIFKFIINNQIKMKIINNKIFIIISKKIKKKTKFKK